MALSGTIMIDYYDYDYGTAVIFQDVTQCSFFPEMSVYQNTRHHTPESCMFDIHRSETQKSHFQNLLFQGEEPCWCSLYNGLLRLGGPGFQPRQRQYIFSSPKRPARL